MKKRMIPLVLVLGLVLGGCGKTADSAGENETGSEESGGAGVSAAGTLPEGRENVSVSEGAEEVGEGMPEETGSGEGTSEGTGEESTGETGSGKGTPVVQGGPFGAMAKPP